MHGNYVCAIGFTENESDLPLCAWELYFTKNIRLNTKYMIHPDEILAQIFMFLFQKGIQYLGNVKIMKRMREILKKK